MGKKYAHTFIDYNGIEHNLVAECYTDDDEVKEWNARWDVTDSARSDGEVRTHGVKEEMEMGTHLSVLSDLIKKDYPSIKRLGFDYAEQAFIQS